MPLLRLLDPQLLTPPVLDFLAQRHIRTWEDLLITDLQELREQCNDRDACLCDEARSVVLTLCHQKSRWRTAGEVLSGLMGGVYSFGCARCSTSQYSTVQYSTVHYTTVYTSNALPPEAQSPVSSQVQHPASSELQQSPSPGW